MASGATTSPDCLWNHPVNNCPRSYEPECEGKDECDQRKQVLENLFPQRAKDEDANDRDQRQDSQNRGIEAFSRTELGHHRLVQDAVSSSSTASAPGSRFPG